MGEVVKDYSTHKPKESISQWLKLEEGTTTIRVLSHSYHFDSHYIKSENKSYDCAGNAQTCQYSQSGSRPRGRWAYVVLVRGDEITWKVSELGWSIFETVLQLAKDPDYGDPRNYDLKITRKGSGRETSYTVIPGKAGKLPKAETDLLVVAGLDTVEKATDTLMSFYKREGTPSVEADNGKDE